MQWYVYVYVALKITLWGCVFSTHNSMMTCVRQTADDNAMGTSILYSLVTCLRCSDDNAVVPVCSILNDEMSVPYS